MTCKYCDLDDGTKLSHLSRCPLNPRNNKLILTWLEDCFKNKSPITGTSYSDFAREHELPVSNTIYKLLARNGLLKKGNKITDIFTKIIYRTYALNPNIDLEILDLYVYRLSYGMFGMNSKEYLSKVHEVMRQDGLVDIEWETQYVKLAEEICSTF